MTKKLTARQVDSWRPRSPLEGALLGMLVQQPGYGYELANRLERRLGSLLRIERRTLYRTLERMERAEVAHSDDRAAGRTELPRSSRLVYVATPTAERLLGKWLMEAPAPLQGKTLMPIKIAVARVQDTPLLLQALDDYERQCFQACESIEVELPAPRSFLAISMHLARANTLAHLRAELLWVDAARRMIREFAQSKCARL